MSVMSPLLLACNARSFKCVELLVAVRQLLLLNSFVILVWLNLHYWKPYICRVPTALPSSKIRALGKRTFY